MSRAAKQLVGAASLALLGCAEPRELDRYAVELEPLRIVEVVPNDGADAQTRIDLCFSAECRVASKSSRTRGSADLTFDTTLHSADLTFDTQLEVQLVAWRAPASRSGLASERWCPGSVLSLTPAGLLQPGIRYRVQLRPALLGWAGEALDTQQDGWGPDPNQEGQLRWFHEFVVAGSPGDPPPDVAEELPPGPTLTELFEPGEVFDPERAACGCHQTPGELAIARLDLSDPETAWAELILRAGPAATDFPMVTPRQPAESYLIHKLLRTADGQRLHALHGVEMPPDAPLPHADLVRLHHWIATGAEL